MDNHHEDRLEKQTERMFAKSELSLGSKPTVVWVVLHTDHNYIYILYIHNNTLVIYYVMYYILRIMYTLDLIIMLYINMLSITLHHTSF